MATYFTEADYEKSVIELFQNLGYSHIYAPELDRDYSIPFLEDDLKSCLEKINKDLPMPPLRRLFPNYATSSRAVLCSATRFLQTICKTA